MKRNLALMLAAFGVAALMTLTACSDDEVECAIPLCEGDDCEEQELDEDGCPIAPGGEDEDEVFVGKSCKTMSDCGEDGPYVCSTAFLTFGTLTSVVPSAYCTLEAACESDDECGAGAGCYRPFAGVDAAELSARGIELSDLGVNKGRCMPTCQSKSDCREGFECLSNPFERSLEGIAKDDGNSYCAFPEPMTCAERRKEAPEAGSCRLVYQLDGRFQISATPLGMGDTKGGENEFDKRGLLIVDLPAADGAVADAGAARVDCFELDQTITVSGPVTVSTAVYASYDGAEGAEGELSVDTDAGTARLIFDECIYDRNWFLQDESGKARSLQERFTPDDEITGAGCLHAYQSVGSVFCEGSQTLCDAGLLQQGSNAQHDVWTQPWNDLVFGADFETVELGGTDFILVDGEDDPVPVCEGSPVGGSSCKGEEAVEIPSFNPSRTWLSFTGTLVSNSCDD